MARKILLADDSVTAQNMGRKILVDAGYEVIAVNNGSAALKKIAELKPDLAILDVYMPGYSGLEVCQRLKESAESARIPVLLSVGKLEPFKPEEAQRVRAEGYIVKPFEASELLSALAKLEDKVVPRSESKPGRFARAGATSESGRGGEGANKENGWKNRIGFPHHKTESQQEEKAADDSSIYNPVNRDLRTVVETAAEKADDKKQSLSADDAKTVDVAALAPLSLPNDVTPEEVAAIAAAVAQMQMAGALIPDDRVDDRNSHASFEPNIDSKTDINVVAPVPSEVQREVMAALDAETKPAVLEQSNLSAIAPDGMATPIDQGRNGDHSSDDARSEEAKADGKTSQEKEKEALQDVPVTMAASIESVVAAIGGGPRWIAVPAALDDEEAGISLEKEMQQMYAMAQADFAAVAALPDASAPSDNSSAVEPAAQAVISMISGSEPDTAQSCQPAAVADPKEAKPAPVAQLGSEAEPSSFGGAQAIDAVNGSSQAEVNAAVTSEVGMLEAPAQNSVTPEISASNQPRIEESTAQAFDNQTSSETIASGPAISNFAAESEAASASPETIQEQVLPPVSQCENQQAQSTGVPFTLIRNTDSIPETKPDMEAVKSTAAAWASWRQIRDTGKTSEAAQAPRNGSETAVESVSTEMAAAAAAGAERPLPPAASPEPSHHSPDVASIVDSVLADLRPRLMEEISRKMAEKK